MSTTSTGRTACPSCGQRRPVHLADCVIMSARAAELDRYATRAVTRPRAYSIAELERIAGVVIAQRDERGLDAPVTIDWPSGITDTLTAETTLRDQLQALLEHVEAAIGRAADDVLPRPGKCYERVVAALLEDRPLEVETVVPMPSVVRNGLLELARAADAAGVSLHALLTSDLADHRLGPRVPNHGTSKAHQRSIGGIGFKAGNWMSAIARTVADVLGVAVLRPTSQRRAPAEQAVLAVAPAHA